MQPGSLDFGSTPPGSTVSKKVTVFSRGASALTIESAAVQGDPAFTSSGSASRAVFSGSSVDLEVVFRPTSVGPRSARLIITSNAANAPEVLVALVGDSLPPSGGGSAGGGASGGAAGGVSAGGSAAGGVSGGGVSGGGVSGGGVSGGGVSGGGVSGGGVSGGGVSGGGVSGGGVSGGGVSGGGISGGGAAGGSTAGGSAGGVSDAGLDAGLVTDAGCTLLLCGRAHAGVTCAEAGAGGIGAFAAPWASLLFNDATGWNTTSTGRTVVFGDVDGDRRADACGRGVLGFNCALNTGAGFGAMQLWSTDFSDSAGFGSAPRTYATIQLADPDRDGRRDVCGRGDAGIVCTVSDAGTWRSTSFNDATSWGDARYFGNVQFVDVTGDGRSDACGRGIFGISCSVSTGAGFGPYTGWLSTEFTDALGWGSNAAYYQTVQFPDLNGDGKADVCGRGVNGLVCSLSDGTQFLPPTQWSLDFGDGAGWLQRSQWATLQFPDLNDDGMADVCGRASTGLLCALSDGARFLSPTATQLFNDTTGWNTAPSYYATIQFADLDGDRQLDVCARGTMGVMCALRRAGTFGALFLTQALAADATGWSDETVYPTLRFAPNGPGSCRVGPPATPASRVGP